MKIDHDSSFRPDELAKFDAVVEELTELRRQVNARQAREAMLLHAAAQMAAIAHDRAPVSGCSAELPYRAVAAELGAALRVSDRTVQRKMGDAEVLMFGFPETFAAFLSGRLRRTLV